MSHFTLTFEMDNAAFEDAPADEAARILRDVARRVQEGGAAARSWSSAILDVNGNRVGNFQMTIDAPETTEDPNWEAECACSKPHCGWTGTFAEADAAGDGTKRRTCPECRTTVHIIA